MTDPVTQPDDLATKVFLHLDRPFTNWVGPIYRYAERGKNLRHRLADRLGDGLDSLGIWIVQRRIERLKHE